MGIQKAKRRSHSIGFAKKADIKAECPGPESETVSPGALRTLKARQARQAKREMTKGAIEKANLNAENAMTDIAMTMQDGSVQNIDFNKPDPSNGRVLGRKLIRWNSTLDQILLLHMEYELKRRGIEIPFQCIANRFSGEKKTSGSCIQQHLAKLRIQLLDRGAWVPPLPGRGGNKKDDVRGVVKCIDKNGREYERVVGWDEDTSHIFDQLENEVSNYRKRQIANVQKNEGETPSIGYEIGPTSASVRTRGSNKVKNPDVDPSQLVPDEEYDPSATGSKTKIRGKKIKQAIEMKADYDAVGGQIEERAARMMRFGDFEEEHVDRKVVIFKASPESLAKYPMGISGSGDDLYDPNDTVQANSSLSAEIQEDFVEEVSENFSDNNPGYQYGGEADDEAQGAMGFQTSMLLNGFTNFDYDANGALPIDPNTGLNISQGYFGYQSQLLDGPNSLDTGGNWTGNVTGINAGSFPDLHAGTFNSNMAIDPALFNNFPMNPSNLLVDWSDALSYGNNGMSGFQGDNTYANANWNANLAMNLVSNMANINSVPVNPNNGFMYAYQNPSNSGMLLNIDGSINTSGASMSQGYDERGQPSAENLTSENQTTNHIDPEVNFEEFVNIDDVHDFEFSEGGLV